jgi:hypothetical protein
VTDSLVWLLVLIAVCWQVADPEKKKLRGFGPQANYADRAAAACW